MGLVRTATSLAIIGLSFYGGYKYHEYKAPAAIEQKMTIEDRIRSLISEDREQVMKAMYAVGKSYGFEK
ncbi:MAG: hypothetical protein V1837_04890 [Candidatus Woesearchaeota archaeon]